MAVLPPQLSASRQLRTPWHREVAAPPAPRRRFAMLAAALAAAAALLTSPDGGLPGFTGGPRQLQRGPTSHASGRLRRIALRGGEGRSLYGVTVVRPKPKGFETTEIAPNEETEPVVPKMRAQKKRFIEFVNAGYPASDLYVRFPGKTPWKPMGEIATMTGNYEEAIQTQWLILVRRTYSLYPKLRFWFPTKTPIQFGYTDEKANIVTYDGGPSAEAQTPRELRRALWSCGWWPASKKLMWWPRNTLVRWRADDEKQYAFRKPYLTFRKFTRRTMVGKLWWQGKNSMPKRFHLVQAKKRGRVIGVGHTTKWKGFMGK